LGSRAVITAAWTSAQDWHLTHVLTGNAVIRNGGSRSGPVVAGYRRMPDQSFRVNASRAR
jgi:hypothetical protein